MGRMPPAFTITASLRISCTRCIRRKVTRRYHREEWRGALRIVGKRRPVCLCFATVAQQSPIVTFCHLAATRVAGFGRDGNSESWRDQMIHYFWYAAGVLTGVAAAFLLAPLTRALVRSVPRPALRYTIAAACVIAFGSIALLIYYTLGSPEALDARSTSTRLAHPGALPPGAGEPSDSVASAASKLEERIAREGGSRDDWLLLAQSYEFLGRAPDAARARASADNVSESSPAKPAQSGPDDTGSTAEYESRVRANPRDAEAWLGLARHYRQQRDFERARQSFAKLVALDAMTADMWADYADVLASLAGGSLAGESARAIDRALALDRRHPKALWLKASLAYEQRRYSDALKLWQEIRALLPPDSPDARIIDANIAEAAELAGMPASPAKPPVASEKVLMVSGTVSIDRKLAHRVPAGATLFIYAKAVDSPGPPLAVLRTTAASWPVSFRLDDSLAMIPERKLSSFDSVIVEARISRTGNATPTPGDLLAVSPALRPADGKMLQLVISREIG